MSENTPEAAPAAEVNVNVEQPADATPEAGETVPEPNDSTVPVADPENPPASTADQPSSDVPADAELPADSSEA